jgi:hypothetical protein
MYVHRSECVHVVGIVLLILRKKKGVCCAPTDRPGKKDEPSTTTHKNNVFLFVFSNGPTMGADYLPGHIWHTKIMLKMISGASRH